MVRIVLHRCWICSATTRQAACARAGQCWPPHPWPCGLCHWRAQRLWMLLQHPSRTQRSCRQGHSAPRKRLMQHPHPSLETTCCARTGRSILLWRAASSRLPRPSLSASSLVVSAPTAWQLQPSYPSQRIQQPPTTHCRCPFRVPLQHAERHVVYFPTIAPPGEQMLHGALTSTCHFLLLR
jgi:hypothetical protein